MPEDPFDDLEELFTAEPVKPGYTPTRKEAIPAGPVRTPTRKEAVVAGPTPPPGTPVAPKPPADDAAAFHPRARPPMAVICALDDGADHGEWFRMRGDCFVIGRTEGDCRIAHDPMIAPRHCEIRRTFESGKYTWHLNDLQSETGTFVQVPRRPLKHGTQLWLGSRRYRFELAPVVSICEIGGQKNVLLDPPAVTFGRTIAPNDPCLAKQHARFECVDGQWHVVALPSRNGVYVRSERVRFPTVCRFQVGEQRFLVEVVA